MGLIDMDDIAASAINKSEEKMVGKEKKEKTTFGGFLLRFIISSFWFIIAFVASLIAFAATVSGKFMHQYLGDDRGKVLLILGIAILVIFFIITMCIPYLRKKGTTTRFLGFTMLGDAIWWIYLLITGD